MSDNEEMTEAAAGGVEAIALLEQQLQDEKARAEEHLASWQRAQADFTNYKRRMEQEKADHVSTASATLMLKFLPVVDDMDRAFGSLPPGADAPWVEGFRLIHKKLQSMLKDHGMEEIAALGQPFDPRFHEAVGYEEGGEEGIVIVETQKGYKFSDRVLRPSLVVVGKGMSEGAEEE